MRVHAVDIVEDLHFDHHLQLRIWPFPTSCICTQYFRQLVWPEIIEILDYVWSQDAENLLGCVQQSMASYHLAYTMVYGGDLSWSSHCSAHEHEILECFGPLNRQASTSMLYFFCIVESGVLQSN